MKTNVFYDNDANLAQLANETVAVIGYGIQGTAFAANLRDSGVKVVVGNIQDDNFVRAREDGFEVFSIAEAVRRSSIVLFLIPDQAQKSVYEHDIAPNLRFGHMVVFAHGYAIRYRKIVPQDDIDVALLAPRMYGKTIRTYYTEGGGAPAFFDVVQDTSGRAGDRILAVAKAVGFTRSGLMHISVAEETELDLFQEQFLFPALIDFFETTFQFLTERGFDPVASLMELYASGETGETILDAARLGLLEVIEQQGSPTCQFGIQQNRGRILSRDAIRQSAATVLGEIQGDDFAQRLDAEAQSGYRQLLAYRQKTPDSPLTIAHKKLREQLRFHRA